ncbi:hypothetical protein [Nocardioides sp.]|uniref:hypothetical protein n=1 Tax=Nocardioides sp. TaxID=35761 RepID=UPI0039E5B960
MTRRFLSRLGGGVAALALGLATVAVVAEAPANAAGTCTTATTLTLNPGYASSSIFSPTPFYGQSVSIDVDVTATGSCGSTTPFAGTTTVEVNTGAGWVALGTGSASSAYVSSTFSTSAIYRASYSGGTSSSGTTTFQPSVSAEVPAAVARAVTIKSKSGKKAKVTFIVTPAASIAGVKTKLFVKKGKKWKKFSKVKFNKKGKATVYLANSHKNKKGVTPYQLALPAGAGFVGHTVSFAIRTIHY